MSDRLISAGKLKKDVLGLPNSYNGFSDTYDKAMILDLVDEQPTVDAEPVRHGHWIEGKGGGYIGYPIYECSECGCPVGEEASNYCPHCGAKMDEVREDENINS